LFVFEAILNKTLVFPKFRLKNPTKKLFLLTIRRNFMADVILYNSDMATLWYHPDTKIVHHKIHKFLFGEEFQKLLLTGSKAMKDNHAQKWLSDDRTNSVVRKEDIDWGMVNWFPQTVEAGWKYWAIVQPEKVIAQMNMEQLAKHYATLGIEAKFFNEPDEAFKWLESL
jgi:hypothetical protein